MGREVGIAWVGGEDPRELSAMGGMGEVDPSPDTWDVRRDVAGLEGVVESMSFVAVVPMNSSVSA